MSTIPKGTPVRVKYVSMPENDDAWTRSVGREGTVARDWEGWGYVDVMFEGFEVSRLSYYPDELEYLT